MTEQEKFNAEVQAGLTLQDEKFNAFIQEMNQRFYDKVDSLSKQIHDTWRQTMPGVGSMIVAIVALLFAVLK